MFILKLILIPFWPIIIGWKLSSGFSAQTSDGQSHPFLGRLIGTVLIAGLLYYGVFWCLAKVMGHGSNQDSISASEPAPAAEVAK